VIPAGTYVNECDHFQPDWQKAFWGANYPRLAAIKRHYDPDGSPRRRQRGLERGWLLHVTTL
jgi:hypothetical protein